MVRQLTATAWLMAGAALLAPATARAQETMPKALLGQWRISTILPTHNVSCWDRRQAETLLGSTLTYAPGVLAWKDGEAPISEALSRTVTRDGFLADTRVGLEELGIRATTVTEIDLQHEDADITGATTEVPGDTVLLAGPAAIVVSACGVYYRAVRVRSPARGRR